MFMTSDVGIRVGFVKFSLQLEIGNTNIFEFPANLGGWDGLGVSDTRD
jgi:hypothetical protein